MAFEVPVEADRVDNLNFFSVVSRAPVFGTLLWFLSGNKRRDEDDIEVQLDDSNASKNSTKSSMKRSRGLKKAAPSLIGSDISDIGEIRESMEAMQVDHDVSTKYLPGRPKKELSWSDESGRELAQYVDESIHTLHQPKPATEKPIRSAMSRSRSVRSNANRLESATQPEPLSQKFIPSHSSYNNNSNNFKQPHQHNLVEPFSSGTSGIESPQWGWYINTTPPTPEMYYSRPHKSRKAEITSEQAGAGPSHAPLGTTQFGPNPNPVFEGLQDRNKGAPIAWPGVPL